MKAWTMVLVAVLGAWSFGAAGAVEQREGPLPEVERIVVLDPEQLARDVEAGRPVWLPVGEGWVVVDHFVRDGEPAPVTDLDEHDNLRTQLRESHVWRVSSADGGVEGLLLATPERAQGMLRTPEGTFGFEPALEGPQLPGPAPYKVYAPPERPPPLGLADGFDTAIAGTASAGPSVEGPGTATHAGTTLFTYVDSQFVNQYGGMTWPDEVRYIISWINGYFDDVHVSYSYWGAAYDGTFTTYDINAAFSQLVGKSYNGANAKSYMGYKDFDGSTIGLAHQPGSNMLMQFAPDAQHGWSVPDTEFERAYLTTHELGHNNNADHNDHWEQTVCCWHTHRSFMHPSAWYHYHECWSSAEMNKITSYRGTWRIGTPCA